MYVYTYGRARWRWLEQWCSATWRRTCCACTLSVFARSAAEPRGHESKRINEATT